MKKLLSLLAGIALLLAAGYAYEYGDSSAGTGEKMITNDDLPTVTPDQQGATFNQTPAGQTEGSAAGGSREDSQTMKKEGSKPGKGTIDKPAAEPRSDEWNSGTYRMPGY